MKIIRNGQEIELTHEEMRQAYYEMKDEYTIEDIRSIYNLSEDKIDEALAEYQTKLDEAGYQDILAEFSSQYEAWKSAK